MINPEHTGAAKTPGIYFLRFEATNLLIYLSRSIAHDHSNKKSVAHVALTEVRTRTHIAVEFVMVTTATSSAPLIEKHTIGYVPPEDRHGKVRDLFTLWFGGNIAPLPIVTGALGVQMFHLNLLWGIVAIIVGQAVGGVLMALHSAQGPQMGIPQMIQSRAQFGSWGALLVTVIAAVMYVGFFASNIVLAGKSVHGIASSVSVPVGVVIGAVGSGLIGIVGYWYILTHIETGDFLTRGGFSFAGWLATVSLSALWQIAFAQYVSDYSRYLPESVGVAS